MADVLNLQIPSPTFGGSTGGWLRSAETEEKYAITWTSKKEQVFEMPTSGAAIMQGGENLLYLAKKKSNALPLVLNYVRYLRLTTTKFTVFSLTAKFNTYTRKMEFFLRRLTRVV
jgi:photosystem I subunit 2